MGYRFTLFKPLSDLGRRDVELRSVVHYPYSGALDVGDRHIIARVYQDIADIEYCLSLAPMRKTWDVVGSHYHSKMVMGVLFGQSVEGIYGIRRSREGQFYIASVHAGVVLGGKLQHFESQFARHKLLVHLKWVLRRDDEPYLVDISIIENPLGEHEVSVVDGVERPEI